MNDNTVQSLEKLFYQKIMLYDDLLSCFKREREFLMNIDMENLWTISKEKEELGLRVKSIRQEIISISGLEADQEPFNVAYILDTIPYQKRPQFQRLHMAIIKLKDEIEALRKENINFIDDSLRFLDEMIAILTGNGQHKSIYNDKCRLDQSSHNMLLSREV